MKQGLLQSPAFLLKAANYSESDRILTLYTREWGKASCLARAARNAIRRFGSCLRPFCRFEACLRFPAAQGLAILEEAQELESYPSLLKDLDGMASGWRLLELVDQLEESGSAHAELFDALDSGIAGLNSGSAPAAGLRCEAALLSLTGWAPRLDACVQCRRAWPFLPLRFS